MDLRSGIVLIDRTGEGTARRLTLSSGVQLCSESSLLGTYRDGAVIPREPWRDPTPAEIRVLTGQGATAQPGSWVSVTRVPERYLAAWQCVSEASSRSGDTWAEVNGYVSEAVDMEALIAYANLFRLEAGPPLQMGIRANMPGLRTVTMEAGTGDLVGLHVDSWFSEPVRSRHLSPNRIAINLGSEDRFLLYVNLPLRRIWELVHDRPCDLAAGTALDGDLLDKFWQKWPGYPVVRLRMSPGEAYVAPTENIAHDGSTAGMAAWDIYLTILGYFADSPGQLARRSG